MTDEDKDKGRARSPNYPAIGLREAVERTARLYKEDGRAGAPAEAAIKHFGYSSAHGLARGVVSAIKKFGLVEERNGRVVPSKLAIDVFEFPDDSARHQTALREAALKPEVYRKLVDSFLQLGDRLPSDASLKPELIADWKFTPKAAEAFLSDFRDTLEYAGLLDGNTLRLTTGGAEPIEDGEEMSLASSTAIALPNEQRPVQPLQSRAVPSTVFVSDLQGPTIRFDLPRGNLVEIRLRSKLTPAEFQKLKKIFELSELAFVDDDPRDDDDPL